MTMWMLVEAWDAAAEEYRPLRAQEIGDGDYVVTAMGTRDQTRISFSKTAPERNQSATDTRPG